MDTTELQRMLAADEIHEGDVFSFLGTEIISGIIKVFAGARSHVAMAFKGLGQQWFLYEYSFEMGVAGGAFVTPLIERLAGDKGRVWLHSWSTPWDTVEVEEGRAVWQKDIDDAVPYGLDILAAFAPWLVAIDFYTKGLGRFCFWKKWRLAYLLNHPPRPILGGQESEEVCSTEVSHAAKAAGRFDGDPQGQTPLMVSKWAGFKPEIQLA